MKCKCMTEYFKTYQAQHGLIPYDNTPQWMCLSKRGDFDIKIPNQMIPMNRVQVPFMDIEIQFPCTVVLQLLL